MSAGSSTGLIKNLEQAKAIAAGSYSYLLPAFAVAILLLQLDLVSTTFLNYGWLALAVGLAGAALHLGEDRDIALPQVLILIILALSLLLRTIPYLGNSVPLGYDPGLYKYAFEHPVQATSFPLIFRLVMGGLDGLFGSQFLLVPLLIILSASTSVVIYLTTSRLFNQAAGLIAAFLFSISLIQFETFWYGYYKNIVGVNVLVLSLMSIRKSEAFNWKPILLGGVLASTHRPAFLIFGLTYLFYVLLLVRPLWSRAFRDAVLTGLATLTLAVLVNFESLPNFFVRGVTEGSQYVLQAENTGGSFFDFNTYIILSLPIIPFAIIGAFHYWRHAKQMAIAALVTFLLVVLKLVFFNRFIIYLDIFVIVYAALGLLALLHTRHKLGLGMASLLLLLSTWLAVDRSLNAEPLISESELQEIARIDSLVEEDATIMATTDYYAPWLKGWVDRAIIAPGMFDFTDMTLEDWQRFWRDEGREAYLRNISQPVYVHVGERQPPLAFSGNCYELYDLGATRLYKFVCP
jgi:hypothetical protein